MSFSRFYKNKTNLDLQTKMSAVSVLNPKAEIARASHSLAINISAAKGLQEILKSNLGPKGTMKM